MKRRRLITTLGGASAASSLLVSSGVFNFATVDRTVSIAVADDRNAFLKLTSVAPVNASRSTATRTLSSSISPATTKTSIPAEPQPIPVAQGAIRSIGSIKMLPVIRWDCSELLTKGLSLSGFTGHSPRRVASRLSASSMCRLVNFSQRPIRRVRSASASSCSVGSKSTPMMSPCRRMSTRYHW